MASGSIEKPAAAVFSVSTWARAPGVVPVSCLTVESAIVSRRSATSTGRGYDIGRDTLLLTVATLLDRNPRSYARRSTGRPLALYMSRTCARPLPCSAPASTAGLYSGALRNALLDRSSPRSACAAAGKLEWRNRAHSLDSAWLSRLPMPASWVLRSRSHSR